MLRIRKILHPTDFSSCANAAFVHALHLARRHDAALHLLHVAPTLIGHHLGDAFNAVINEDAYYEQQQEEAEARMHTLLATHRVEDLRVRWVPMRGFDVTKPILTYASEEGMDLIVLGTHGHRGVRHWLLGSVAEAVVRRADCPVLTVRARDATPEVTVHTLRRVLVPVDFSLYAHHALRYARALAAIDHARVDLLHVVDLVQQPAFYDVGLKGRDELEQELLAGAKAHMEEFYHASGPDHADVAYHVASGYAPQEILAFAERESTDLIVIATHGLRGLKRYPLGSVTERVVREAGCPVFVARPFGKSLLPPDVVTVAEAESP